MGKKATETKKPKTEYGCCNINPQVTTMVCELPKNHGSYHRQYREDGGYYEWRNLD